MVMVNLIQTNIGMNLLVYINQLKKRGSFLINLKYSLKKIMKQLHFLLLFHLVFFIGCSGEKKNSLQQNGTSKNDIETAIPIIDLEKAIGNLSKEKFNFSNFVSDITYTPLETNEQSIFGGKFAPVNNITENFLFFDGLMFNRDGSFVRKIGRIGQGPQEYIQALGIAVDEKRQEFYIHGNFTHDIIIYDFNSVFKKRLKVDYNGHNIYSLGDGKILLTRTSGAFFDNFYEYQLIDIDNEEVIYTRDIGVIKDGYEEKGCEFGIDNNIIWGFGNSLSYYEFFSDTIFSVENGIVTVPRYQLNMGKYKYSADVMHNTERTEYRPESFMRIGVIRESSQYLFITFSYNKISYVTSYNKSTGELLINKFDNFFNNDIDGGFIWLFDNINGETTGIGRFLPNIGKERIENLSETNKNYNKDKNNNLRKLIVDIEEDDNDVVYFFNLK